MLLRCGESMKLTCNLWAEFGLVNGAHGYIEGIFFASGLKSPQLPQFIIVLFEKYCGVPFDRDCPNVVPITLVVMGDLK